MRYESVVIQTPEYVEIEYELAGIGSRCIAALLDTIVQGFIGIAVGTLAVYLMYLFSLLNWDNPLELIPSIVLGSLGLIWFVGYWVIVEMYTGGQSIGKRAVGLRVIRDDGTPINLWDSILRNLVRIVDFIGYYCVGFILIWVSAKSKRLGDYAAGTIVVKERSSEMPESTLPQTAPSAQPGIGTSATAPVAPPAPPPVPINDQLLARVSQLSPADTEAVKRFIQRAPDLKPEVRAEIAMRIALPLASSIGVALSSWPSSEHFLAEMSLAIRRYEASRQ